MADTGYSRPSVREVVTARRGRSKLHWTDIFTYAYLALGVFLMFGPVVWLVLSSFKTPAGLIEFPPTLLPLGQISVEVEGYEKPLPMFRATLEDGTTRDLAQVRRIGIVSQMVDPAAGNQNVPEFCVMRVENIGLRVRLHQHVAFFNGPFEDGGVDVGRPPAPQLAMGLEVFVAPADSNLNLGKVERKAE